MSWRPVACNVDSAFGIDTQMEGEKYHLGVVIPIDLKIVNIS